VTDQRTWLIFAENMIDVGYRLLRATDAPVEGEWAANTRSVAQALFARTLSNARGALSLIRTGCIVETRVLTRCCLENYFWITALFKDRETFLEDMLRGEMHHGRVRGNFVRDAGFDLDSEVGRRYLTEIQRMNTDWESSPLPFRAVAARGPVNRAYALYGNLSSDAAHPSFSSLKRYIRPYEGKFVFDPDAITDESEEIATLEQLCCFTLGTCANLLAIAGNTSPWATGQLQALVAEFEQLVSK